MLYYKKIDSIVGEITIVCDDENLIAVWIEGQSDEENYNLTQLIQKEASIISQTESWLKRYFNLERPQISELPIKFMGTPFQLMVWEELCKIPYGEVTTYKAIALQIAKKMNKAKMSAQAVGQAVGRNPISIIVPCHRVIGSNGAMIGYNGGISIKEKLLRLEKENLK
ncbi:MAG: methylated-DNA--[protein]-cysteine S-methyltransferase [Anaeroplasmataceae bacterium]|nr:methylated-DNA--[protein]-cysteine S-methyltransferase [Anaeroplasmataceae bacterium]